MALVDTLDFFPSAHPAHARIKSYILPLANSVMAYRNETAKGWELVLTAAPEDQYIESSAGAMFTYLLVSLILLYSFKCEANMIH